MKNSYLRPIGLVTLGVGLAFIPGGYIGAGLVWMGTGAAAIGTSYLPD